MNRFRRLAFLVSICALSYPLAASDSAPDGTFPVVGSTAGAFGSNFRTELQLNNRSSRIMSGWLVFRTAGVPGSELDPMIRYEIEPHSTLRFEDIVAELGIEGIGSLDVMVDEGGIPSAVARAFDDQEEMGTAGATIPLVLGSRVLKEGRRGVVIVPADLERTRFNIGVRSFGEGAEIRLTIYGSNGVERAAATRTYPANHFIQMSGEDLVGGSLLSNEAIEIELLSGSAIVYGTTTDNRTNDPSIQLAVEVPSESAE